MARARCPDWPTLSAEAMTSPIMTSSRYRQPGSPVFQVDRRRKGTSLKKSRSFSFIPSPGAHHNIPRLASELARRLEMEERLLTHVVMMWT